MGMMENISPYGRRLEHFFAVEAAECGLACLAMVANWHGHQLDMNGMRQRFSTSARGATLHNIIDIAEELSLISRPLRIELGGLRTLPKPAIIHWELNHFVVLASTNRRGVTIHDPAKGVCNLTWDQVSEHFTGVALELSKAAHFTPTADRSRVRLSNFWSKLTGLGGGILHVLLLSGVGQLLALAAPLLLQIVVDDIAPNSNLDALPVIAGVFVFVSLLTVMAEALRGWSLQIVSQSASLQIAGNIVAHLLRLPGSFFERRQLGDILSRITSIDQVQSFLTKSLPLIILNATTAAFCLGILTLYSPRLAAVALVTATLNALVLLLAWPPLKRHTLAHLEEAAKEQSHLIESLRGIVTIKLLGGEQRREMVWRNHMVRSTNAALAGARWEIIVQSIQHAVTLMSTISIVVLATYAIIEGNGMSIGMLVAFLSYRQIFSDQIDGLIAQLSEARLLRLHMNRLSEITDASPEYRRGIPSMARCEAEGRVTLRGIDFRYGSTDPLVLRSLDLAVTPGEFLAITGRSGEGKSTLLKIMLGLETPCAGEILLDHSDPDAETWRAWRRSTGVVTQDDKLLTGTIAENIAAFDADMDMERVLGAATQACIHDDILRMPMQYFSLIGDMGSHLSGGQRQRILIARALYRQPRILMLDEGTANLDIETERVIADMISSLSCTRIVIAHRPALLERADRVMRLAEGKLVASNFEEG